MQYATLVECLQARAVTDGDRLAFRHVAASGEVADTLTYGQLDQRARAIAIRLLSLKVRGQPVLLCHPPGLEFIAAFYGCLYAGAIAVPCFPPDPTRLDRTMPRLQHVVDDCKAALVLTSTALLRVLSLQHRRYSTLHWLTGLPGLDRWHSQAHERYGRERLALLSAVPWLASDRIGVMGAARFEPHVPAPDVPAYVQYTSGSTRAPRGVVLSHANVLANVVMVARMTRVDRNSVAVGWVPLQHDLGLVCGVISAIVIGYPGTMISPLDFLRRPMLWLELVSRYRGTHTAAPDFAYLLCLRKSNPAGRAALDLRTLKVAGNGGERVRASTISAFSEAFAVSGFRRSAFMPTYGLAEASLFIASGKPPGLDPRVLWVDGETLSQNQLRVSRPGEPRVLSVVSCGRTGQAHEIRIVEPRTLDVLPDRRVGEIVFRGPSVAHNYFNAGADSDVFNVTLKRAADPVPGQSVFRWLRTGDLGFIDKGELFVTGRIKDLLVIRGRNLYPTDLEWSVEQSHPSFRTGCVAICPIMVDDEERVVAVAEVSERLATGPACELDKLFEAAVAALSVQHDVRLDRLLTVSPRALPRTSTGKIRRARIREQLEAGVLDALSVRTQSPLPADESSVETAEFPIASNDRSSTSFDSELLALINQVMQSRLDLDDPLSSGGLDSLALVEISEGIKRHCGVTLWLEDIFSIQTTRDLANRVRQHKSFNGWQPASALPAVKGPSPLAGFTGWQPATPAQRFFWEMRHQLPGSYRGYTALDLTGPFDALALEMAWNALLTDHPVLRSRFELDHDCLYCRIDTVEPQRVVVLNATHWSEQRLEHAIGDEVRRHFDLGAPPLARLRVYRRAADHHVIQWVAHHVALDIWSFYKMTLQLLDAYAGSLAGVPLKCIAAPLPQSDGSTVSLHQLQIPAFDRLSPALDGQLSCSTPEQWVDSQTVQRLRQLAGEQGVPVSTLLLTVYAELLSDRLALDPLVLAIPVSSRDRHDTDSSGPMMHFMPLVYRAEPLLGFDDAVLRVAHSLTILLQLRSSAPQYAANYSDFPDVHFCFHDLDRLSADERMVSLREGRKIRVGQATVRMRPVTRVQTSSPVSIGLVVLLSERCLTMWLNVKPGVLTTGEGTVLLRQLIQRLKDLTNVEVV